MCSDLWAEDKTVVLKARPVPGCQVLKKQSSNLIRHKHTLCKGNTNNNVSKLIPLKVKWSGPSKTCDLHKRSALQLRIGR